MLEKATYMKIFFKWAIQLSANTIPENAGSAEMCWFYEKSPGKIFARTMKNLKTHT